MEELGYATLHRSSGYSNHLHDEEALGRVDFVYVRGDTKEAVFDSARRVEGPGGRPVLVPKPEHLAAMKILAVKNDPDRKLQDLADVAAIARLPNVDLAEIEATFERHGMLALWRELDR